MYTLWSYILLLSFWISKSVCAPLSAALTERTTPAVPRLPRALTKRAIQGPELNGLNFPDPSIIRVNGVWYAFATRTRGSNIHIQAASSPDFETWTLIRNPDGSQFDALPNLPPWVVASSPNTWAPDISQLSDGTFIMYYSASTVRDASKHCVGAARSRSVKGPYVPVGSRALFCDLSTGGAIDASGFKDGNTARSPRYVVYKADGNSIGHGGQCGNSVMPQVPTPLVLQRVGADGVTKIGAAVKLLDHDAGGDDDGILEAPVLVKRNNKYFLFFSAGCYTSPHYDVSYAVADRVTGPYTRVREPLIETGTAGLQAPGGPDITVDGSRILFHANLGSGRAMYEARLVFRGSTVSLA